MTIPIEWYESQNTAVFIESINDMRNIQDLGTLRRLENDRTRPRKSVLRAIDARIELLTQWYDIADTS